MRDRLLALFAKLPVSGRVKTRLCPPLSPHEAARLYEAMLLDILDQHRADTGADRVLWYTPAEARGWFERAAAGSYRLRVQQGASLAERMRRAFWVHAEEGYRRIVLRGTDSPTLPLARVESAFETLARADGVLCPDLDGGYNLIGLRRPCDALFELEMSRSDVLARTQAQARELGLRLELLAGHHDVDRAADLERLREGLCEERTPRTLGWFRGPRASIGS